MQSGNPELQALLKLLGFKSGQEAICRSVTLPSDYDPEPRPTVESEN
jgi:hypothetical protein